MARPAFSSLWSQMVFVPCCSWMFWAPRSCILTPYVLMWGPSYFIQNHLFGWRVLGEESHWFTLNKLICSCPYLLWNLIINWWPFQSSGSETVYVRDYRWQSVVIHLWHTVLTMDCCHSQYIALLLPGFFFLILSLINTSIWDQCLECPVGKGSCREQSFYPFWFLTSNVMFPCLPT